MHEILSVVAIVIKYNMVKRNISKIEILGKFIRIPPFFEGGKSSYDFSTWTRAERVLDSY